MQETKTMKINKETWKNLYIYKGENGFSSFDEAIKNLLKELNEMKIEKNNWIITKDSIIKNSNVKVKRDEWNG